LQEVERIDANPGVLKALAADALKKRLEVLEDDTAKLAGFCTFAMASEAPTRVQLERCIDAAQRQSAEQLAALIGGLEGRLGALAAGQQRLGSKIDVLVGKQLAVLGKEEALEQNRIDPADVTRTGEVKGTGAYGVVTKVVYAFADAAMKSIDMRGLTVEQRNKVYVRSSARDLLVLSRSSTYSLTHSLTHSLARSLAHPLTHSLTHSRSPSLTYSTSTCCNTPGTAPSWASFASCARCATRASSKCTAPSRRATTCT
jgi:hypothetical protein